jgi:hypothetical protein
METKKPWQSKTYWMALITAASAFIPAVQTFIQTNPSMFAMIMSAVFAALRQVTHQKISIE